MKNLPLASSLCNIVAGINIYIRATNDTSGMSLQRFEEEKQKCIEVIDMSLGLLLCELDKFFKGMETTKTMNYLVNRCLEKFYHMFLDRVKDKDYIDEVMDILTDVQDEFKK